MYASVVAPVEAGVNTRATINGSRRNGLTRHYYGSTSGFAIFSSIYAIDAMADGGQNMSLALTSPDFVHQGEIPKRFTCQGNDSSPTLSWSGVPANAKSLVLIVDDPIAPDPAKLKMT
jgi:phosphatidylethanolamine-binding protein (PEBP) family uncharacterized protein